MALDDFKKHEELLQIMKQLDLAKADIKEKLDYIRSLYAAIEAHTSYAVVMTAEEIAAFETAKVDDIALVEQVIGIEEAP